MSFFHIKNGPNNKGMLFLKEESSQVWVYAQMFKLMPTGVRMQEEHIQCYNYMTDTHCFYYSLRSGCTHQKDPVEYKYQPSPWEVIWHSLQFSTGNQIQRCRKPNLIILILSTKASKMSHFLRGFRSIQLAFFRSNS